MLGSVLCQRGTQSATTLETEAVNRAQARTLAVTAVLVIALNHQRRRYNKPAYEQPRSVSSGKEISRHRSNWLKIALTIGSLAVIVISLWAAFKLTNETTPNSTGTIQVLVPAASGTDPVNFSLEMDLPEPGSRNVQYVIDTNCGYALKHVILILSGDARIENPRTSVGSGLYASYKSAKIGRPWFTTPRQVQLFNIPAREKGCPQDINPTSIDGSALYISGEVASSFESSAGASHAFQLPQLGSWLGPEGRVPGTGKTLWELPIPLAVKVNSGGLPLGDQVGTVRPALTASGNLSWSGETFIQPSATWTDTRFAGESQFFLLPLGSAIGIAGSVLATIVLDSGRPQAD